MKNYINKVHPAILTTVVMIAIIVFVGLVCIYPIVAAIAGALVVLGMAWVTIYEAIVTTRIGE